MPNKEASRSQGTDPKMVSSPQQSAGVKTPGVVTKVGVGKKKTNLSTTNRRACMKRLMKVEEARVVCQDRPRWKSIISAYLRESGQVKDTAMSPTPQIDADRPELLGSLTTLQQQRTSARVIKKLRLEPDKDKRVRTDDIPECETPIKIDDKELKFPTVKQRMPKALWSTDEKSLFFEALNEYGKDFDAITAYICAKMKKKGMSDGNLKTKTQVSHFYYRTWHKLSKHVRFDENVKKVAQELYALINYGELRKKLVSVNEKTCARLGEMVLCGSIVVRARGKNVRVRTPMCRALRRLNQITERLCGARVCSRAQVTLRARDSGAWARVQAAAHNPRAAVALPLRTRLDAFIRALQKRWRGASSLKLTRLPDVEPKLAEDPQTTEEYPELRQTAEDEEKEDLEEHLHLETDRIIVQEQKLPKKPALHVGPRPHAEVHLPAVSPGEQLSSQKICFSSYLERMCSQRIAKGSVAKIRTPKRQRKDSATDKDKEDAKKFKMDDHEPRKLMNIDETAIDGIELMANYKNNIDDEEKPSTEDEKEIKAEETAEEEGENMPERDKDMSEKEKDSFSEMEDDEKFNKSDTDNESDHGKEKSAKDTKFKNLKVKFRIRPKKRGGSMYTLVIEKDQEEVKSEEPKEEEPKPDIDVELAIRQIRQGWSVHDAGELTIGDLYLMFGSRSKIELDYWWAEPTPPLPAPNPAVADKDKHIDKKEKADKTSDKDSSVEEGEKRESDTDIFSPKNTFGQDSNDGMSGDERKSEQLASPDHKSSATNCSGTLKLVSKLVNRPTPPPPQKDGFSLISDRLKRLLALVGNPHVNSGGAASTIARCTCGHVCPQQRRQIQKPQQPYAPCSTQVLPKTEEPSTVFRHPTAIAPRPDNETQKPVNLEDLPRWRRGRPRLPDRRVVVQRLLPLLPKLPTPTNLVPVKTVPNLPQQPPRILPKPPPTSTSDLSFFYVLSESNGQFFFHDGDRRIPITPLPEKTADGQQESADGESVKGEDASNEVKDVKMDVTKTEVTFPNSKESGAETTASNQKTENNDIANFLPSESLSLSPSRLLRDSDAWLDGSVQDFSLSSFLGHLEGRPQPDLAVDSQLHSLMAESSVDYVAKFADLAAEVTDEGNALPTGELT